MKQDFAKRLSELRKQSKMSSRTVARFFFVDHTSYLDWEHGISEPGIDTICAICKLFDVSADYLLGLKEI